MLRPEFQSQVSVVSSAPPDWLDQRELQQVLNKHYPLFRSIDSFRFKPDHNGQRLQLQIRLADQSTRSVNYVVKSPALYSLKLPRAQNFQVELHMYNVVLPALESLYKSVGKEMTFAPISLPAGKSLFLEDLHARGYRVANLPNGLDKLGMEVVLSKLAAYHAVTACYLQTKPAMPKELVPKSEKSDDVQKLRKWLQQKFHESLRGNNLRQYEDRVKNYQTYRAESKEDLGDSRKSFNVILIGACSANNLLGQFDAFNQIKDVLFTDFGGAKCGSAVLDLLQVLLTTPSAKTEHFDGHLRHYVDDLTVYLKLLKFKGKIPTLTDIQLELLNYGPSAFEVVTEILPFVLAEFDSGDIDDLFKLPKYAMEIQKLLPWLENRGYFEVE